jgi:hypothetical protein
MYTTRLSWALLNTQLLYLYKILYTFVRWYGILDVMDDGWVDGLDGVRLLFIPGVNEFIYYLCKSSLNLQKR